MVQQKSVPWKAFPRKWSTQAHCITSSHDASWVWSVFHSGRTSYLWLLLHHPLPPNVTSRGSLDIEKYSRIVPDGSLLDPGSTRKCQTYVHKVTFDYLRSFPKSPRRLSMITRKCYENAKHKYLLIPSPHEDQQSYPCDFRGCLRRLPFPEKAALFCGVTNIKNRRSLKTKKTRAAKW